MKRGYSKKYNQRAKDNEVFSVVKRVMEDDGVGSVKAKAQNNELRMKVISYNAARMKTLIYSLVHRVSTEPQCAMYNVHNSVNRYLNDVLHFLKWVASLFTPQGLRPQRVLLLSLYKTAWVEERIASLAIFIYQSFQGQQALSGQKLSAIRKAILHSEGREHFSLLEIYEDDKASWHKES